MHNIKCTSLGYLIISAVIIQSTFDQTNQRVMGALIECFGKNKMVDSEHSHDSPN